jgi:hypothetical protein
VLCFAIGAVHGPLQCFYLESGTSEDELLSIRDHQTLTATGSQYIRWLEDLDQESLPEAGGKGANLGAMIDARLPVPPGFVVTADAYRAHLDAGHLPDRIAARLQNLLAENVTALTAASDDIMGWIASAPMPDTIRADVASSYDALSGHLIVRKNGAGALPVTADGQHHGSGARVAIYQL